MLNLRSGSPIWGIIVHNADNGNYVHAHEYVYFECACICAHCHASEESVYAVELFFFAPPSKGMYMELMMESIQHFLWMKYANSFPRGCRGDMPLKESTNCRQKMERLQRNCLYHLPSLYIIPFIDMFAKPAFVITKCRLRTLMTYTSFRHHSLLVYVPPDTYTSFPVSFQFYIVNKVDYIHSLRHKSTCLRQSDFWSSLSYDDLVSSETGSDDLPPPDSVIVVDRRHAAAPICGIFGDTYIPCNIHDEGIRVYWESCLQTRPHCRILLWRLNCHFL